MRRLAGFLLALAVTFAQGQTTYKGLVLSTPYPALTVKAGEVVNLPLTLRNYGLPPQLTRLRVEGAPADWTVAFLGSGRVVEAAFLAPDATQNLTLRVEVPKGVGEGRHTMTVLAEGTGARARLPLTLTVGKVLPPSLRLEVELPVLKGTPKTTFRYRATLKNESDQDLLVGLEADAPQGFEVVFKPQFSGQEVTTLPIKAGETKNIDIEVSPPPRVQAGEYRIDVAARSGAAKAGLELTAVITGRPELSLTTPDGRLSGRAYAGRTSPLKIVVKNRGSAEAKQVEFSSYEPSGWELSFEPKRIDSIPAGEQAEVTVKIKPSSKAIAGDYMVTLTARPKNGTPENADFRITVLTSTVWGVVGVGLIAVALGVLALAVARFGRR
ncbi:NEW3 domain-containing protein [Oceanithermus sp.]|uniref:COG1470 family protein n=1 Tax=Oceanithermus sp. TaxID=2268145 RepID=UPI00257E2668|nr:NEW3 domain-containing protein [Oceanithermus sp.]